MSTIYLTASELAKALTQAKNPKSEVYAKVWVTNPPRFVSGRVVEVGDGFGNIILQTEVNPLEMPEVPSGWKDNA